MGPTAFSNPGPLRSFASKVATEINDSTEAASRKRPTSARWPGPATAPPPPFCAFFSASAFRRVAISCLERTDFSALAFRSAMTSSHSP